MNTLQTLTQAYEDFHRESWQTLNQSNADVALRRLGRLTADAWPDLLEAMYVLRNKMNPLTNNQENHDRALKVLDALFKEL